MAKIKQTKQQKIDMWESIRTKFEGGSHMADISEVQEGLVGRQSVYRKAKAHGWIDPEAKVKAANFVKREINRQQKPKDLDVESGLKHAGGRPTAAIDYALLDKLCSIHCTGLEIAGILEMDYDTLNKGLKREQGMGFTDYFSMKSASGKAAIRRKQIERALEGNVPMLIWVGKQILGQAEKSENTDNVVSTITVGNSLGARLINGSKR